GAGRPSPRRAPWIRPGRLSRATYIRRLTRGAAAHSCRCSTSREGRMADYSLAATDVALHGVTLEEGVADTVTVATTADYVLMVHPGATEPVYVGFSPITVGDADAHAVFGGFGLELASVPGGTTIHIVSDVAATYTLERTSAKAVRYAIAAAGGGGIIGTITPEDIGAAPEEHTHEQADITGLTAALNGKASTSHNLDADYAAIDHDHDSD